MLVNVKVTGGLNPGNRISIRTYRRCRSPARTGGRSEGWLCKHLDKHIVVDSLLCSSFRRTFETVWAQYTVLWYCYVLHMLIHAIFSSRGQQNDPHQVSRGRSGWLPSRGCTRRRSRACCRLGRTPVGSQHTISHDQKNDFNNQHEARLLTKVMAWEREQRRM